MRFGNDVFLVSAKKKKRRWPRVEKRGQIIVVLWVSQAQMPALGLFLISEEVVS